ncbi:MAG: hypothetical protein HY670_09250 [Chloroflexi bacterium]|nr:hypothetical protein [Chloroflexota bacterium]
MKRYLGGNKVKQGVYLNMNKGELLQVYGKDLVLPGDDQVKYVRIPAPLAVIGGPFAGLAFIIFVPLTGVIGAAGFLVYKLGHAVRAVSRKAVQPAAVGWEPGKAYLTRMETRPKETPETGTLELDKIQADILKRREQGEP